MALPLRASVAAQALPTLGTIAITHRGSASYELLRAEMVWQVMKPARFPDLIVRARDDGDVVPALRYARAHGMTVAVRCGGHNYTASFLRDGGMLLDVSRLRAFVYDRHTATAWVGPGLRAGELAERLAAHGRAFPIAHAPTVPLGGYLLGGGIGWNGDWWGRAACFNVRAVELVTAGGARLRADAATHPELFWAARGAGPGLCAVATRFQIETFALPSGMRASRYAFSPEVAADLAARLADLAARRLPNLELTLVLEAGAAQGRCVVSAVSFEDDPRRSAATLAVVGRALPLSRALERDAVRPVTFTDLLAASNTGVPRRLAADNMWTDEPGPALERLAAHFARAPSPHNVVIANFRAHAEVAADAAFSVLGPAFVMWFAAWDTAAEDDANLHWVDEAAAITADLTRGCYVNETDLFRRPERVRLCYSAGARERLARVRAHYDPNGVLPSPVPM